MAVNLKRKKMWVAIFILIVVIVGLSFTKFEIKKEVVIDASRDRVWEAVTNFEEYDQWNTQLQFLGGEVKPRGKLHLKLDIEGTEPYEFKPSISHWDENNRLAWLAITGIRGIFDGEHFFELEKHDENQTKLINREVYSGVLSLIIKNLPMMREAPKGFDKMNQELKNYIENKN